MKVKFTGFATDKSGSRVRLDGETKTRNDTPRSKAENSVRNDLQLRGYRDIHIDDTRITDS